MLLTAVLLCGRNAAYAQTTPTRLFIDINGGGQTSSSTITTSTSFDLYGERAVVNTAQSVPSGGLVDGLIGYRFRGNFGVAVGVSRFSGDGDGNLSASIPNPAVINRPAVVTASASNLRREEFATHISAVWFIPATDKFDFTLYAGPSFFSVDQDIMTATVVTGTQTVNTGSTRQSENAVGGHVGATGNYMFLPTVGVGIFIRYAGGSADLPSASDVKVGGFHVGGGLRLRF
jgi:hypothetical protein